MRPAVHADPGPVHALPALSAVPSTLRIPLAARALGDALFPAVAVGDAQAARLLAALGDDGSRWLQDLASVYGVLARTRHFRTLARRFLQAHPGAVIANLGCGLSDYWQWLDDGRARMVDADLPEVVALRRRLLPPAGGRHRLCEVDLAREGWWGALGLPARSCARPVFAWCEGVLMYLSPDEVWQVLHTFGEHAPAGSMLSFDALCWLAQGMAAWHASVGRTEAQFGWGVRRPAELAAAHPRLRLVGQHPVMAGYGWPCALAERWFEAVWGVPFYALYVLCVDDEGACADRDGASPAKKSSIRRASTSG